MNLPHLFAAQQKDIPVMKERRDIPGLIRALRSPDFTVQTEAARALGTLGAESMDDLIRALKKKHKDVRLGVIGALAVIRDPRSVDPLIAALRDTHSEVRWHSAFALAKLGWKPETAEERAFYFVGMQEWKALEWIGPEAIPALSGVLSDRDAGVRQKAIELLGSIGSDKAVPALMQGLADSNSEVRWQAVLAAPRCGIDPLFIPRGISRRPRTAKNPFIAAIMNFLLPGLGYGYIGKWWGIMIFQIDVTATVWLYKYEG